MPLLSNFVFAEDQESHTSHTENPSTSAASADSECSMISETQLENTFEMSASAPQSEVESTASTSIEITREVLPTVSETVTHEHPTIQSDILKSIKDILSGETLSNEVENFTTTVADKLAAKLHPTSESQNRWTKADNFEMCDCCMKFSNSRDVPAPLRGQRRGNFGFVSRDQSDRFIKSQKQSHEKTDLHNWCKTKKVQVDLENAHNEHASEEAGQLVIRNVLLCLKKGWSAEDFMSLNDKDNLTNNINAVTKNDSKAEFFSLRSLIFEKVTQRIKTLFEKVESFSVTLDKVTVNRVSFTVIVTYFFWEGSIHVLLNKLVKISTTEYDGPGTASMVISCLTETLGLTRTQLASKLVHFCYDGVYATEEQRVRGGGSLSLIRHVAEQLDMDDGDISGVWDASHNMQLVFSDVMKDKPVIMKTMKILFDAMKEFNLGKGETLKIMC